MTAIASTIRALTAFAGFLGLILFMCGVSFAWRLIGFWPPPSKDYR